MKEEESKKSWLLVLILCFFLGVFGIHNFYTKKIKIGIIQFITLGGLGIWALIDLIFIIQQKFKDKDGNIIREKESENKVLKFVIGFMIVSIIISIIYTIGLINKVILYKNNDYVKDFEEISQQEPEMQVFIKVDATQEQIDIIEKEIKSIDGVGETEFISKDEALNQLKEKFNDKSDLISNYEGENNIFPASFIVRIKDQSKYKKVYEQILKIKNVKKVTKNDVTIKNTTMIVDNINGMFKFLIILIIIIIINVLCKIAVIISILKRNGRSGKKRN